MPSLTVLYDANCRLCRQARRWLEGQPQWVPLTFVAACSREALDQYPDLDHARTLEDLTVVLDNGQVYWGAKAWILCLWALRDHRQRAVQFSRPKYQAWAKRFVAFVARKRHYLGTVR